MNEKFATLTTNGRAVFGEHINGSDLRIFKQYFGRVKHRLESNEIEIANRYFERSLSKRIWFECDCVPGSVRRPLLAPDTRRFVFRLGGGDHPPHSEECTFFRSQKDQKAYTHAYRPPDSNDTFLINRPNSRLSEGKEYGDSGNSQNTERLTRARRPTSLQRILWIILNGSGINVTTRHTVNRYYSDQSYKVLSYAQKLEILKLGGGFGEPVMLSNILCVPPANVDGFLTRLSRTPLSSLSDGQDAQRWPRSIRPQGYLIAVVNDIDGNKLIFKQSGKHIRVAGRIGIFGEDLTKARRFPYLAILHLANLRPDTSAVEVREAYLHPIVSIDNWSPVDSDYERTAYRSLVSIFPALWARGYDATLTKPLFNLNPNPEDSKEVLLPDFQLQIRNRRSFGKRTIFVEVMGYNSENYLNDKNLIHRAMMSAGIGPIVRYDAFRLPHNQEDAKNWIESWLEEAVFKALGVSRSSKVDDEDILLAAPI